MNFYLNSNSCIKNLVMFMLFLLRKTEDRGFVITMSPVKKGGSGIGKEYFDMTFQTENERLRAVLRVL